MATMHKPQSLLSYLEMKVALPVPFALRFVCQKGFVTDSNFVKCSGSSLQTFWKMHSPMVAMMQPKVSVGAPA